MVSESALFGLVAVLVFMGQIHVCVGSTGVLNEQGAYLACSGNESMPSMLHITEKIHPLNELLFLDVQCMNASLGMIMYTVPLSLDVWYTEGDNQSCVLDPDVNGTLSITVDFLVGGVKVVGTMTFTCPQTPETTTPLNYPLPEYPSTDILAEDVANYVNVQCGEDFNSLTLVPQSERTIALVGCIGHPIAHHLTSNSVVTQVYSDGPSELSRCVADISPSGTPYINVTFFRHETFESIGNICLEFKNDPIVQCNASHVMVDFPKPCYDLSYPGFRLHPNCRFTTSTTDLHTTAIMETSTCDFSVDSNATHLLYNTHLVYDRTDAPDFISRERIYNFSITCSFLRRLWASPGNASFAQTHVLAEGSGEFSARIQFWANQSFDVPINDPLAVHVGDYLAFSFELNGDANLYKIGNLTCFVTPYPSNRGANHISRALITDGVVMESSVSLREISTMKIGIWYRVFRFVHYPMFRLHCKSIVCEAASQDLTCDQVYSYGRVRRSAATVVAVSSLPLRPLPMTNAMDS